MGEYYEMLRNYNKPDRSTQRTGYDKALQNICCPTQRTGYDKALQNICCPTCRHPMPPPPPQPPTPPPQPPTPPPSSYGGANPLMGNFATKMNTHSSGPASMASTSGAPGMITVECLPGQGKGKNHTLAKTADCNASYKNCMRKNWCVKHGLPPSKCLI